MLRGAKGSPRMLRNTPRRHRLAAFSWMLSLGISVFGVAVANEAWAGEVKFGKQPLSTDSQGNITDEGRKASVTQLPSEPGEEVWILHVWAKIDKGAPGPLYVEIFGKLPDGKPYLAKRHEHSAYEGQKFVTMELELDGNQGFNKNRSYDVEVNQLDQKGKTIKLAAGKIDLTYTEPPKDDEEEGGGEEDDGETQTDEQDERDSLAGPDEQGDDGAPPPVAPTKKGCSVDPGPWGAAPGLVALFGLGAWVTRRRRR
jgi:MYXO-CTERM domain-containing protein